MKAWRKISHPRWDNVRLTLRHPKWRYLLQKIKRLQILVQIIFLLAYNGWNIVLFSPGCYEKRAKHLFPVFPPWLLLWQKQILAPLNLIKWFFFLSRSLCGVSTPLTAQNNNSLHLISHHPQLEKYQKWV